VGDQEGPVVIFDYGTANQETVPLSLYIVAGRAREDRECDDQATREAFVRAVRVALHEGRSIENVAYAAKTTTADVEKMARERCTAASDQIDARGNFSRGKAAISVSEEEPTTNGQVAVV
jgi:hypothetical protein